MQAEDSKMSMITRKVALVTGGSRGIGRAIVERLAGLDYHVIINYRSSDAQANELLKRIEDKSQSAELLKADISTDEGRECIIKRIDEIGRLDVLVNNAGIAPSQRRDILEMSQESFDKLISVNLKAPVFLTCSVANLMLQFKSESELSEYNPKIVFISSVSAELVSLNRVEYCISKAGLSMAVRGFALRLAEYDIPVFELRPGITETDMTSGVKDKYDSLIKEGLVPMRRWGRPDDIANAVEAIVRDLLSFSTSSNINIDGGLTIRRL